MPADRGTSRKVPTINVGIFIGFSILFCTCIQAEASTTTAEISTTFSTTINDTDDNSTTTVSTDTSVTTTPDPPITSPTTTTQTSQGPSEREPDLRGRAEKFQLSVKFEGHWNESLNSSDSSYFKSLTKYLNETLTIAFNDTDSNGTVNFKWIHVKEHSEVHLMSDSSDIISTYDVLYDQSNALLYPETARHYLKLSVENLKNDNQSLNIDPDYLVINVSVEIDNEINRVYEKKADGDVCCERPPSVCYPSEICYTSEKYDIGIACGTLCSCSEDGCPSDNNLTSCSGTHTDNLATCSGKHTECVLTHDKDYDEENDLQYKQECSCQPHYLPTAWDDCFHEGWAIGISVGCGVILIALLIGVIIYDRYAYRRYISEKVESSGVDNVNANSAEKAKDVDPVAGSETPVCNSVATNESEPMPDYLDDDPADYFAPNLKNLDTTTTITIKRPQITTAATSVNHAPSGFTQDYGYSNTRYGDDNVRGSSYDSPYKRDTPDDYYMNNRDYQTQNNQGYNSHGYDSNMSYNRR